MKINNPWPGKCAITGKTVDEFVEMLKDCTAPEWAQQAAISICRSYGIKGICDPAYIANVIWATKLSTPEASQHKGN